MNNLFDDPNEIPQMSNGLLADQKSKRPDSLGIG